MHVGLLLPCTSANACWVTAMCRIAWVTFSVKTTNLEESELPQTPMNTCHLRLVQKKDPLSNVFVIKPNDPDIKTKKRIVFPVKKKIAPKSTKAATRICFLIHEKNKRGRSKFGALHASTKHFLLGTRIPPWS